MYLEYDPEKFYKSDFLHKYVFILRVGLCKTNLYHFLSHPKPLFVPLKPIVDN